MEDRRRRPCLATSDPGPAASSTVSNSLRAASSFQARSRAMIFRAAFSWGGAGGDGGLRAAREEFAAKHARVRRAWQVPVYG